MMAQRRRQYCTFALGEYSFGVPVESVQEVFQYKRMTPVPLAPDVVRGLINLRGQIVTAIDLRRRLQMPEGDSSTQSMNVVIRTDDGGVSLLVDEIADVVDVDYGCFETPPETLTGVARELIQGAFKLEGRLLLLLDTERVAELPSPIENSTEN
jgi:purine-binding chemotaxis protein CheW